MGKAIGRRWVGSIAFLFVATTAAAQTDHVFFGNLHSHTSYSDGSGTPSQAYRHARDVAHLDFLAITEHNHSLAESGAGDRRDGLLIATNHALYTGPDPEALIPAANRLNEDGHFVAIYGQEFSTISSGNHVNVFNVDAVIEAANGDFAELVTWLQAHPDAQGNAPIVELNHPADFDDASKEYGIDDFSSTASWLSTFGPYVHLIEVLNGPGLERTDGHAPRVMQADYLDYLNRGFHVAPAGDQDNHYPTWGTLTEARTAVVASTLTRAAVLDALRNRHVYATEDRNLELIAKIDGHLMGDIIAPPAVGSALAITLAIRDGDEPDAAYRVEVFVDAAAGGAVAQSVETFTFTGDSPVTQPYALEGVRFESTGQYVFLKVTQLSEHGDADRAWTAPVWFEPGGGGPPPASTAAKVRITSLLANPAGDERQNETVTLKNTGTASINLTGWTLRDEAGTTWSLSSLGTLAAGASKTIHRSGQAMSLNNGGDTIVLLDPSGTIIQSVTYPAMAEGQAFTPP